MYYHTSMKLTFTIAPMKKGGELVRVSFRKW